jgi:glycosyltransferase involved in cell wall biosynthesis
MNGAETVCVAAADVAPLFSVVIPLYNRAATISQTIASVLAQSCQDFEIIVVDDGSTDNPYPALAAISDPRIRYVCQPNGGGGSARNRGIREAGGRYIAFLDSDDFFLPGKLDIVRRHLDGDPMTVWYSYIQVDRGVGRSWIRPTRPIHRQEDVGDYLFVHNEIIQTSAIVLPRALADAVGFDSGLRKGQDLDFCLRLQRAGARFRMIEQPLIVWVDISEAGRTSRTPGYAAILGWLDRCGHLLSPRAVRGYRATVLAYYMAGDRPLAAARDLAIGLILAGVPLRVVARQALRAYLPRQFYRNLVNTFVRNYGRNPATIAADSQGSVVPQAILEGRNPSRSK